MKTFQESLGLFMDALCAKESKDSVGAELLVDSYQSIMDEIGADPKVRVFVLEMVGVAYPQLRARLRAQLKTAVQAGQFDVETTQLLNTLLACVGIGVCIGIEMEKTPLDGQQL